MDDLRQIVPLALFDKLKNNPQSPFFQKLENKTFLVDRVSWIRQLFDRALQQQAAYQSVRQPLLVLQQMAERSDERLSDNELKKRLAAVQKSMEDLLSKNELNGPVYEDLLRLKSIYSRYQNRTKPRSGFLG
jgi:hypothetical protein